MYLYIYIYIYVCVCVCVIRTRGNDISHAHNLMAAPTLSPSVPIEARYLF